MKFVNNLIGLLIYRFTYSDYGDLFCLWFIQAQTPDVNIIPVGQWKWKQNSIFLAVPGGTQQVQELSV